MTSTYDNVSRWHTGHVYNQFDRICTWIVERLASREVGRFGFPDHVIRERLVQRASEFLIEPYANWIEAIGSKPAAANVASPSMIGDRHCSLNVLSGQLALSTRQKATCWREFWVMWLRIVFCSALPRRSGSLDLTGKRACLLYGVGNENLIYQGTDERFAEYLASTPVTPLRNATTIVVATTEKLASSHPERIAYARDPLLFTWRQNRMGPGRFLRFLAKHLALPFRLARQSSGFPELLLIARDIAHLALVGEMDRYRMLGDIVYTSSDFHSQPLWLRGTRNFAFCMVHYSQAWQVFVYSKDKLRADFPQMRWVRCDEHWVWTDGFARYIAERDVASKIHVVGPILWYQPSRRPEKKAGIVLTAFDVPALPKAAARECGDLTNFWKVEHLMAFVDDLVRLRADLDTEFSGPVRLILKIKRFHPVYDQNYPTFIADRHARGQFELAGVEENMFDLIASSHIAIVFPYSSPVFVAASVGVPAIYHDPTGTLMPTYEALDGIWFSSGYDELLGRCKAILATELNTLQ